ncbi:hypothetical protein OQA88_3270 [Cercophora sp. LCS_1]
MLEQLLGVAAKSLIRHAVVGVLTGGVGNVFLLAGDAMDAMDVMDAVDATDAMGATDAVDAVSSTDSGGSYGGHHDVHFGANGNDGFYQQGVDDYGNKVSQSSTGPAYSTDDPSKTYGQNDVKWP